MALPSLLTEPFPVFDLKSLFRAIPPRCSAFMSQLGVQWDEHRTKIRSPFTTEATYSCTHTATQANPSVSFILQLRLHSGCLHDILRIPVAKNNRIVLSYIVWAAVPISSAAVCTDHWVSLASYTKSHTCHAVQWWKLLCLATFNQWQARSHQYFKWQTFRVK